MKASKTKFVGVWIDAEMYQALIAEMHADPKSRSLSDTVRACLKHHLFGDDGTILKEFVHAANVTDAIGQLLAKGREREIE